MEWQNGNVVLWSAEIQEEWRRNGLVERYPAGGMGCLETDWDVNFARRYCHQTMCGLWYLCLERCAWVSG